MAAASAAQSPPSGRRKYEHYVLAAIISLISLPPTFFTPLTSSLDGSWMRALNLAVKNHLVFGRDFIFTYGPLGFLASRNTQYVNRAFMLAGDLLLVAGIFYFSFKILKYSRGWFMILAMAMFLFKGVHYGDGLFLIFTVFVIANCKNDFRNYFELGYCAFAGVLSFFVKVNFSLIAFGLLFAVLALALIKNRRSFIVFAVLITLFMGSGLCMLHVDVPGYTKATIELIENYDDAVSIGVEPASITFLSSLALILLFFLVIIYYFKKTGPQDRFKLTNLFMTFVFCLSCFLFYKNGFTRGDYGHNYSFFAIFPLFLIFVFYSTDLFKYALTNIIASVAILISTIIFVLPQFSDKYYKFNYNYVNPMGYLAGIFEEQKDIMPVREVIINDKLKLIGNSTIDIFPVEISSLVLNHMNYYPRPVPQSYTVYSGYLDSINAAHFSGGHRPEMLMMRNDGIDDRYGFWDESLTKAAIHLNYSYLDFVVFDKITRQFDRPTMVNFLLLKVKDGSHLWPRFEKIGERTVNLEEEVPINFPDSAAIYMTADMEYTVPGEVVKTLFQSPGISITLYPDAPVTLNFRVIKPIIKCPVLINKFMGGNFELKNFMEGNLKLNHNIRAFSLHTDEASFKKDIKITFWTFANY